MRAITLGCGAVLATCFAAAQTPDLVIFTDARMSFVTRDGGDSRLRWYDPMGRHGVVGLSMVLENGYRVMLTQRLERVPGDGDPELLDEAYINNPGFWRVGRQFLPFGTQTLFRESVLAARLDTQLVFGELPLQIAGCDGGSGRTRGVAGRIGRSTGVSFAFGDHFGIASTALTPIRTPEETPGRGRGWEFVVGADSTVPWGPGEVQFEFVVLRDGHSAQDQDEDVSDLRYTALALDEQLKLTAAWTRKWQDRGDFVRLESELQTTRNLALTSFLRFGDRGEAELGFGARVRF